ncbi:MAG: hypothetical protein WBW84_17540 [Acidobacteriaceae bacterium]
MTQPQPTQSANPSVRRAGWVRQIAETLAGGPRYQMTIDPQTGASKPVPVPVSNRSLGLAIAMEAISGGLTGLGQHGPDAAGKAAAAGVQQGEAIQARAQARQQAQAQQDYQNQSEALVRKAQAFESNSRAILSTQQAERLGLESLKDAVAQNADLLDSYRDNGAVSQEHVLQDDLMAGLQSGKLNFHSMVAIPDGWTNVPGKGYEQTFTVVNQPSAKVLLTQQMVDNLAAAHVPGFPSGMKVPTNGYPVPGVILANANQRAQANRQMLDEASDVSRTLARSDDPATKAMAQEVPDIGKLLDDPKDGLALQSALPKLQKYLHHDGSGDTFYQGLVAMAQPQRPSPANPKVMMSNATDASAAQTIAGAFGNGDPQQGWQVLKAYHDEITPAPIKSESEAEGIISDPASNPRQKVAARQYLNLVNQQKSVQATAEARAKAAVSADASGVSDPALAHLINPANVGADGVNHTFLSAMQQKNPQRAALVQAIGQGRDLMSTYGLSRKDAQALMGDVNAAYPSFDQSKVQEYTSALKDFAPGGKSGKNLIAANTALTHLQRSYDNVGLLTSTPGLSAVGSLAGVKGAGAYKADVNALASEIATAYKGGVPDKQEVERWYNAFTALNPNSVRNAYSEAANLLLNKVSEMHDRWNDSVPSSFVAPVQFITDSAAQSFKHVTGQDVPAELRRKGPANAPSVVQGGQAQHVVPAGATPGRDPNGNIIGYRTADGQVVRF